MGAQGGAEITGEREDLEILRDCSDLCKQDVQY